MSCERKFFIIKTIFFITFLFTYHLFKNQIVVPFLNKALDCMLMCDQNYRHCVHICIHGCAEDLIANSNWIWCIASTFCNIRHHNNFFHIVRAALWLEMPQFVWQPNQSPDNAGMSSLLVNFTIPHQNIIKSKSLILNAWHIFFFGMCIHSIYKIDTQWCVLHAHNYLYSWNDMRLVILGG